MNNIQKTVLVSLEELEELFKNVLTSCLLEHKRTTQPEKEDERPLTIKEAAAFLNLKIQTVYGLTSKKVLPHMKKRKNLYFSRLDLLNYVESGKKKTIEDIKSQVEDDVEKRGLKKAIKTGAQVKGNI